MAKTQIQNVSSAPIGLPTPFRGILLPGARIVVAASVEEVREGLGGSALRGALELVKMEESAVDDGMFWLGTLPDFGKQASWAIDGAVGNDRNPGTPSSPLRTMREFNDRMTAARVSVLTTLQLVGDVLDEPLQLPGTRFRPTSSLTVLGTKTALGTGTISTVTPLGVGGTTFPWRLVTTGMAWTSAHIGAQILTASSQLAFVQDVIDGNTIEVGWMCSSTFLPVTPTAEAFTVYSLSRALPPSFNMAAVSSGTAANIAVHIFDLSMDGSQGIDLDGGGVQIGRCSLEVPAQTEWRNAAGNIALLRGCRVNCTGGGPTLRGRWQLTAVSLESPGTVRTLLLSQGDQTLGTISCKRVQLSLLGSRCVVTTGGMHFSTVGGTRVVQINRGGSIYCDTITSIINGASCSSTTGIEVTFGSYLWLGPDPGGAKPTLGISSGCTADVKLGGGATIRTFTYAALGAGKQFASLSAVPPLSDQIETGGFAFMGQVG